MRVALVVMPLADVDRPSLAAGLLQAELKRRDIACDTKYFNVLLWRMLGAEAYNALAHQVPITALPGEWAFSQAFHGKRFSDRESYAREVLDVPVWGLPPARRHPVWALEALAPVFLRAAFESVDWGRYDVVGFTSTFQQTMASLGLARMIRERYPRVKLVAGGANFEGGMGRPYLEHFGFLDFIATGEADTSFAGLCEALRDGTGRVPPGFLYRQGDEIQEAPPSRDAGAATLDALPTPDYADYFAALHSSPEGRAVDHWLSVESARGCWWGEHAHCTFCGLNGGAMAFRRKHWRRVVAETDELLLRHGPARLHFADNILAMESFDELLPHWASAAPKVAKFFEIKSNLKRRQVRQLAEAGITLVQAGVESLADGTLKLMRKGVSAAQNVALLRWCHELGIRPMWLVLYGFPREDPEDYARTLAVMKRIPHLPPPSACVPIRMDRFSPNHSGWREQGFTRVAPMPAYRHVYPFPEAALETAAYYFQYEHPGFARGLELGRELVEFNAAWSQRWYRDGSGELAVRPHWQGGFVLVDTRFNTAPFSERLSDASVALLLACDAPASHENALQLAARVAPETSPGEHERLLARLVDRGIVAQVGKQLVTLALLPQELQAGELHRVG